MTRSPRGAPDRLDARAAAVLGALAISLTGVFFVLAETSSSTAVVFRCLFALPLLLVLARWERRHRSVDAPVGLRARWTDARWHLLGGAFLGVDMVLWNESIAAVGAGVSTVLVNVQVVVVPLLGLLLFGERVRARFWPVAVVLLAGVALAGGVGGGATSGPAPVYGTVTGVLAGCAYAGYLVVLARGGGRAGMLTMLARVTAASGAVGVVSGLATGTLDLTPPATTLAWLLVLALSGQIVGWILIASALPRLSSTLGPVLLLVQPVAAVLFGMVLLGERLSPLQVIGCAVVLGAVVATAVLRDRARLALPVGGAT